MPPWLMEGSEAVAHWTYDAEGRPLAGGTAADGIVDAAGTVSSTPAAGSGAGGVSTGGTNFIVGCDTRQDFGIELEGFDLELHLCMDVYSNLAASSFSGYTPEQLCPTSIVAPMGTGTGSLQVTALARGCNTAGSIAVCSVTASAPGGIVFRYDIHFYDARTYDAETCDILRDAYSRASASNPSRSSGL